MNNVSHLKGGIEIRIKNLFEGIEIFLIIPEELRAKGTKIFSENKMAKVDLDVLDDIKSSTLIAKSNYKVNRLGVIQVVDLVVNINTPKISGTVVIHPKFYVTPQLKESIEKKNKHRCKIKVVDVI